MKKDVAQNHYMKDPERVADLLNAKFFDGNRVIEAKDVVNVDGRSIFKKNGGDEFDVVEREQDIVFHIVRGANCLILGLEQQNYMDPSMVLRSLEYMVIQYENQRDKIMNNHKNAKDLKGDEFLSDFSVYDRLKPTIIVVVYYGDDDWYGARTLHELLDWTDIPEEWKRMFADYQMHLIEVKKIEDLDKYHSDLKLLFGFLKYRQEKDKLSEFIKQNKTGFKEMSIDLARVIHKYSHSKGILKIMEKNEETERGTVDMCKAFLEMIEDGRKEGIKEGIKEGRKLGAEQFGELVLHLISDNRTDDLKIASKDDVYRQQLFNEYGIAG